MSFNPYLSFGGNCRQAFTRYREIFGGQLDMMTMGDLPASEAPAPPEHAHLIMHAAITFGENLLMGSDDPTGDGGPMNGSEPPGWSRSTLQRARRTGASPYSPPAYRCLDGLHP